MFVKGQTAGIFRSKMGIEVSTEASVEFAAALKAQD
jgi:hypothetical protein